MHRYIFEDQATRYARITKQEARKLWGKEDLALCPCNLRPGYPFGMHMVISAKTVQENQSSEYGFVRASVDFDNVVFDFTSYNCTCNETGKYTAFYTMQPIKGQ